MNQPPPATLRHYLACQGKDLKRFALPWWLTPSCPRFSAQFSSALHHWSFIRLMSLGWTDSWPTSQGQVHSIWRQESTVWGKGEEGEDGGDFNLKHYKTRKKFPFSLEHLQMLLHQSKDPKSQSSLFTKRPWFLSKQVSMPLICLCESRRCSLHPANLALSSPCWAWKQQHLLCMAAWAWAGMRLAILAQTQHQHVRAGATMIPHPHSRLHINLPRSVCPFLGSPNNTAEPLFLLKGALNSP